MEHLSNLQNSQTMSSREIAEYAEKLHKDVLEAIRNMEPAWEKVNGRKFSLVEYRDAKGEMRPMYQLSKTECLYVATKFNDEARAKLIIRWEELEKAAITGGFQIPQTFSAALQLAAKQAEQIEKQQEQIQASESKIAVLEPKAEYVDKTMDLGHLVDVGQTAKLLKLPFGRNTLFMKLKEKGVFFKNRNEPKQEYIERGYFDLRNKTIDRDNHPSFMITKVLVTQKGLFWLSKMFGGAQSNFPQLNPQ